WDALIGRVRPGPERQFIDSLRIIEGIRGRDRVDDTVPHLRPLIATGVIAWLGLIQSGLGLSVFAIAWMKGSLLAGRAGQVMMTIAFGSACILLAGTASHDPRRRFLLVTFACAASTFARGAMSGVHSDLVSPIEWAFRGLCLEVFIPACLWQFALDFPRA